MTPARAAIITNGVVTNVIMVDKLDPSYVLCPVDVGTGWTYDGTTFVAPPPPTTGPPPDYAALNVSDLNAVLITPGSVVRALGLVMFAEINKLRVLNGDPPYTLVQFKAALVAQMGVPS